MKSFEQWDTDELELTFGLKQKDTKPALNSWLASEHPITDEERRFLTMLRDSARKNVDAWNEDELKMKFIAPLLLLINFDQERYRAFSGRKFKAVVQGVEIGGEVDFVVATGRKTPREPFFFVHEYKRERGRERDPLGQLLAGMLAAQELNATPHLLYGCYVLGRNWFFVVLEGREYAVSDAFVSTQDDIFQIFSIVKEAKQLIEEILSKIP
jgi:hypothetical protein